MGTAALSGLAAGQVSSLPQVKAFFEHRTCSVQYVVSDPATGACALVDPVLDYDEKSASLGTTSADALLAYVAQARLRVVWILDRHCHI